MSDLTKRQITGMIECNLFNYLINLFIWTIVITSYRCVLEYGKDDNDRLTNTLGLRRMGTTLAELQNEFTDDHPAYALFRVVSYSLTHKLMLFEATRTLGIHVFTLFHNCMYID